MTAQLIPALVYRDFTNGGEPLAFGLVYTYAAGTTTPQATYVDSTQTTQQTNPVVLNARGEAQIWLNPSLSYKFVVTDSNGNTIRTVDNITGFNIAVTALVEQLLYPQTPAEALASVTATSMQYPPYTAFRYMTAAQITDVQAGTLQTDTAAALTTLFSIKQASGNVYAQLQPGTYGFSSLTIANNGVYNFQGAILTPTAATSTPFAIQWQAAFSDCYGL